MPRKISISGLQEKLEHLQRDILIPLRGGKCELCGSTRNLVADHCFKRTIRQLFFERANLTILCNDQCHFKKSKRIGAVDLAVYQWVRMREGDKKFDSMQRIAERHEPFPSWSKRWWLENKQDELEKELLCAKKQGY